MIRLLSVVLLLSLLSACSQVQIEASKSGRVAWDKRVKQLQQFGNWTIRGRISVISEDDGWHASLFWQQQLRSFALKIIAPLGQGTVYLAGNDMLVGLRTTRNPQPVMAPNAELLLYRYMGWQVPVTGMRYWVRGLPVPNVRHKISVDEFGRPIRLSQNGWKIDYVRFNSEAHVAMPVKLKMQNDQLKVKLIISSWKLGSR